MATPSDTYFETLGAALEAFIEKAKKDGAVFECETEVPEAFNGGISYEQSASRSFALASYKGRKTRKGAHVTLYRMASGRYELVSYIL